MSTNRLYGLPTIDTTRLPELLNRVQKFAIGGDTFFNQFDHMVENSSGFPPYNLEKVDDDHYRLTLAVAGFAKDELTISVADGNLVIESNKQGDVEADEARKFVHRGIAERNFKREFKLMEYVIVTSADLQNGLLTVELARELPEALKPRTIEIGS